MKISYNWLKQYLSIDLDPQEVAVALTGAGLEVEDIITFESVKGSLEGIVTGQVMACQQHPNADKLSLTKVDIGTGSLLSVVCGAPNVAQGQKVLVATIGTTLFKGEESFQIKQSKIRGELSEGMICAEDEIGLGTSHDGIMVLPDNTLIGKPASFYFPVEKDVIFEIGLTPNRSDAASHIGVARDLAAVLNHKVGSTRYRLEMPSVNDFQVDNQQLDIEVYIEDIEACPRYSGLTISDVVVAPSPEWLQNKLKAIGVRPINNIVDITNYVLFETGQPLHAFDAAAVKKNKVIVKKLPQDTPFVTLDEVERKLSSNDLMICNAEAPMCIGGVFGGLHSGVSDNTTSIFLESACFDSKTIRKTARLHALQTDASFRFERGSDPNITVYALKRAALLIKEVAGGTISSEVKDVYPQPVQKAIVNFSFDYLNRLAGQPIAAEVVRAILKDLGFEELQLSPEAVVVSVPTFKVDVYRPADIVEEVLRVYGYDNISIPEKLNASVNAGQGRDADKLQHAIADMLSSAGFTEIMNNSLTRSEYVASHPAYSSEKNVAILNPLSKELDVLRQTLLFGGLETIAYNQNRKALDLKLFEFGKVYGYDATIKPSGDHLAPYNEYLCLDLFLTGNKQQEIWNEKSAAFDFFDLKYFVEGILSKLRINRNELTINEISGNGFDYAVVLSFDGQDIVRYGQLEAAVTKFFDLRKPVFYASIQWEKILKLIPEKQIKYEAVPRFPVVRRDLALVLDKHIKYADIEAIARKTEPNILHSINLFDIYEGDKIPEGKKSYAVSFVLVDKERTLTDKVIEKTMHRILSAMEQQLQASLR